MPFPRTWVEELIVEWLHLEGFFVVANLPVSVSSAGGRGEVDVVGARIENGQLEIFHVETGQLSGGKKSIVSVKKKFSLNVKKSVEDYFKKIFFYKSNIINYKSIYIATYWTKPTIEGLKGLGVEVFPLPLFIKEKVLATITRWRESPPHTPKGPAHLITLPECHWLILLLDYLKIKSLLRS